MPYVDQDEWKAVSETLPSKGGWELVGGALRRDSSAEAIRVRLHEAGISIDMLGGVTPVQGEGSVGSDYEWYFRSRGERWSFQIHRPGLFDNNVFYYEEAYGEWPEAGYISEIQALRFIEKAVEAYTALRLTA